jgi:hypothetical protein
MINSIKGNSTVNQSYESKANQNVKSAEVNKEKEENAAVLELGSKQYESKTYTNPGKRPVDVDEVNRLWEESQKSYRSLRELVEKLLSQQGKKFKDVLEGKEVLLIDEETRAAAASAISEDGEWGVKAVSERIVAFAKAVSGNDKAKLGELKAAIEQGFKEAEKALGGVLPDISKKTYDEVMRQLDEWEKSE